MFASRRQIDVHEIAAFYRGIELRTTGLRIAIQENQNMMVDYALSEHATPYMHRMTRPALSIVLDGEGRFDEAGKRLAMRRGTLIVSDQRAGGTEAFAPSSSSLASSSSLGPRGGRSSYLSLEWDPHIFGAPPVKALEMIQLTERDRTRIEEHARELWDPLRGRNATVAIIDLLRSVGLPMERISARDLIDRTTAEERRLSEAIDHQLSNFHLYPSLDEVADDLGWSSRHTNRRFANLAQTYGLPWEHWRSLVHMTRLLAVFRLLSAPGATTELVARKTGFRSAAALCHTLAKANLPSPGVLARAAQQRDPLDAWTEFLPSSSSSGPCVTSASGV